MTTTEHWSDTVVMPALLRFAWRAYGGAVRAALADGGFDDLPRNGAYVVGGMAREAIAVDAGGPGAHELAHQLGVSKQAVSQLLDTLVARGYLTRAPDPADRRRLAITLTERGQAAAETVAAANQAMDAKVTAEIGADAFTGLRRSLGAVIDSWDPAHD